MTSKADREPGLLRRRALNAFGPSIRLSVGRLVAGLVSAVWLVILARSLPKEDFAVVVLALSLGSLSSLLHDGGQCLLLTRQVAETPGKKQELFFLVLRRRLSLSVFSMVAGGSFFGLVADIPLTAIAMVTPSVIATILYTTVFSVHRSEGHVGLESLNEVISRISLLLMGAFFSIGDLSALKVISMYSAVDVVSALVVVARNRVLFTRGGGISLTRNDLGQLYWRASLVVGASSAAGTIVSRIDPLMISARSTNDQVANFSIGFRIVEFLIVPIGALIATRIAVFARNGGGSEMIRTMMVVLGYSLMAVLCMEILAGQIPQLFGVQYNESVKPFRILALILIPAGLGSVSLGWLTVHRARLALMSVCAGLMTSLLIHLLLTQRYGAVGASIAAFGTSLVIATCSGIALLKVSRSSAA